MIIIISLTARITFALWLLLFDLLQQC